MKPTLAFKKAEFHKFFDLMKGFGEVFAPVRVSEQSFSFKSVGSANEIAFEALRTILPPKKFFYPQHETLLKYNDQGIEEVVPEIKAKVIFGVHPCDLAGLGIIDKIFTAEPADTHYMHRKQKTLIVGLSCMPDKHCFCKSVGTDAPQDGYDVFLTDVGEDYVVEVNTPTGLNFIEHSLEFTREANDTDKSRYKDFWVTRDKAFQIGFEGGQNLAALFDLEHDNPVWEELGNRCLSCGNCVPVCPTCYCFDLVDIASLSGEEGERVREWDACQFTGFAKVAGDYNFRPGPVDRLKFWYRHKLHGFDDPYGFKTCVGCGRCTVSCPAEIDDIVGTVLRLQGKSAASNQERAHSYLARQEHEQQEEFSGE